MFERWRPPIIPSATTAERSDSTAPSSAIVNAAPINPGIWWNVTAGREGAGSAALRSEEHTSELQSQSNLVCRLLLEKKKIHKSSRCGLQAQRYEKNTQASAGTPKIIAAT